MTDNITQLRSNPLLNDVPGWLRKMANDWEAGMFGERDFIMVIVPAYDKWDWPQVIGIGDHPGQTYCTGLLAEAQAFMTIHKVARAP